MQNTLQIPKEFLVLVGGAIFVAILFFGIGAGSICSIVGFIYPAFKSFEAIESKTRGDDTQWLIYWVVYAFFAVIESFSDFLLYWIPFYYAFKVKKNRLGRFSLPISRKRSFRSFFLTLCFLVLYKLAFLLWAMLPQTKGAKFLYDVFLKDFLKKNESKIDAALADAKKTSSSIAVSVNVAVSDAAASSEGVKKDN